MRGMTKTTKIGDTIRVRHPESLGQVQVKVVGKIPARKPTKEQLKALKEMVLYGSSHSETEKKHCVMEAVAYITGQPHTDHPICVSNVICSQMQELNDEMNQTDRQKLKQLVPWVMGTAPLLVVHHALTNSTFEITDNQDPEYRAAEEARQKELNEILTKAEKKGTSTGIYSLSDPLFSFHKAAAAIRKLAKIGVQSEDQVRVPEVRNEAQAQS